MRILFDECVDYRLKKEFVACGHEVSTVQDEGLGGQRINERDVAKRMAGKFDVYLTTERNNRNTFQNDIGKLGQYREQYPIGFMILKTERGKHPTYQNLKQMMPTAQLALENMRSGILIKVHGSGVCEFHGLENKQRQEQSQQQEFYKQRQHEKQQEQDRGITHRR